MPAKHSAKRESDVDDDKDDDIQDHFKKMSFTEQSSSPPPSPPYTFTSPPSSPPLIPTLVKTPSHQPQKHDKDQGKDEKREITYRKVEDEDAYYGFTQSGDEANESDEYDPIDEQEADDREMAEALKKISVVDEKQPKKQKANPKEKKLQKTPVKPDEDQIVQMMHRSAINEPKKKSKYTLRRPTGKGHTKVRFIPKDTPLTPTRIKPKQVNEKDRFQLIRHIASMQVYRMWAEQDYETAMLILKQLKSIFPTSLSLLERIDAILQDISTKRDVFLQREIPDGEKNYGKNWWKKLPTYRKYYNSENPEDTEHLQNVAEVSTKKRKFTKVAEMSDPERKNMIFYNQWIPTEKYDLEMLADDITIYSHVSHVDIQTCNLPKPNKDHEGEDMISSLTSWLMDSIYVIMKITEHLALIRYSNLIHTPKSILTDKQKLAIRLLDSFLKHANMANTEREISDSYLIRDIYHSWTTWQPDRYLPQQDQ
jgi:hypothetical protein